MLPRSLIKKHHLLASANLEYRTTKQDLFTLGFMHILANKGKEILRLRNSKESNLGRWDDRAWTEHR